MPAPLSAPPFDPSVEPLLRPADAGSQDAVLSTHPSADPVVRSDPGSFLPAERVGTDPGFTRLAVTDRIAVDLRYAGAHNFAGRPLYGALDCAWLRTAAAAGLQQAAAALATRRPGWRLLVLDALRPQRVQEAIWRDVVGTPLAPYFAPPEPGSMHSFGLAVDVTLLDPSGQEADMGTGFDEMTLASHPALHAEHLAGGVLTPAQVAARETLRAAMACGGFAGIDTEWWHFDHGDRDRARRELPRVW